MEKCCSHCNEIKNITEFDLRSDTGKHRGVCHICMVMQKRDKRRLHSPNLSDTERAKLKANWTKANKVAQVKKASKRKVEQNRKLISDKIECTVCNKVKNSTMFSRYFSKRYNRVVLKSRCMVCEKLSRNNKYKTDKGIFKRYKSDATRRNRNYSFDLTFEQFSAILNKPCFYCGDMGRGVDRVNNSLGYSVNNCVPCCKKCNEIKMSSGLEEMYLHLSKMVKHFNNTKDEKIKRF